MHRSIDKLYSVKIYVKVRDMHLLYTIGKRVFFFIYSVTLLQYFFRLAQPLGSISLRYF